MNETCGNDVCVNQEGTYQCSCIGDNQENFNDKICLQKILGKYEIEKQTENSGKNTLKLPSNPVVVSVEVVLSSIVIAYIMYIIIMDIYLIQKSIYRFVYTESVLDVDHGSSDEEEEEDDDEKDVEAQDIETDQVLETDQIPDTTSFIYKAFSSIPSFIMSWYGDMEDLSSSFSSSSF